MLLQVEMTYYYTYMHILYITLIYTSLWAYGCQAFIFDHTVFYLSSSHQCQDPHVTVILTLVIYH